MKFYFFSLVLCVMLSCNRPDTNTRQLQARIDSLQQQLNNTYKPGFGEFMSGIQVHHAKLWFAGINENWKLADFEIHEIMESIDDIKKYQQERTESKSVAMLEPALDSVNVAIQQQSVPAFKKTYLLLTNTCNSCHKAVNYSFNEVKVPETPPFSNQVFLHKEK